MTKFENPSFSVFPGSSKSYRDNYDDIFGKKKEKLASKGMDDLPPPREAQAAPSVIKKPKRARKKKTKNEKAKSKKKKKK